MRGQEILNLWTDVFWNVPLMATGVQLLLDVFLLIQYLICHIIYLLNVPYVHLHVTFTTRIIGKFSGSFVLYDCPIYCWKWVKVQKEKRIIFLFFPTPLIRSKCCSMLTILLVMFEADPNSVLSSSDVESKEMLTSRGKKKKKCWHFFFGKWDHHFRKQNSFPWQTQSSLPTTTSSTNATTYTDHHLA